MLKPSMRDFLSMYSILNTLRRAFRRYAMWVAKFQPWDQELYSFHSAGPRSSFGIKTCCQQDGNESIEKLKVGG